MYFGYQNIWFIDIFSHPIGCLFIFVIVSFAVQNLFSLMFYLNIFVACAFGVISKKNGH